MKKFSVLLICVAVVIYLLSDVTSGQRENGKAGAAAKKDTSNSEAAQKNERALNEAVKKRISVKGHIEDKEEKRRLIEEAAKSLWKQEVDVRFENYTLAEMVELLRKNTSFKIVFVDPPGSSEARYSGSLRGNVEHLLSLLSRQGGMKYHIDWAKRTIFIGTENAPFEAQVFATFSLKPFEEFLSISAKKITFKDVQKYFDERGIDLQSGPYKLHPGGFAVTETKAVLNKIADLFNELKFKSKKRQKMVEKFNEFNQTIHHVSGKYESLDDVISLLENHTSFKVIYPFSRENLPKISGEFKGKNISYTELMEKIGEDCDLSVVLNLESETIIVRSQMRSGRFFETYPLAGFKEKISVEPGKNIDYELDKFLRKELGDYGADFYINKDRVTFKASEEVQKKIQTLLAK